MKLTPDRNKQAEPLCKFGPGGDFIDVWQPEPLEPTDSSNRLVKLLASAVEAATITLGLRRTSPYVPSRDAFYSKIHTFCHEEKVKNAVEDSKSHNKVDPATTTTAKDGGLFSAEPMLFPDLSRNGIRIKHKPKHRIRTYRRAAKKGITIRLSKQGSLFESQFTSARTA